MKLLLDFEFPALEKKVEHTSSIFLIGSCFAQNITTCLQDLKYNVLSNPHGILYNAKSIMNALLRIVNKQVYTEADLVQRDGLFHCFDFHSSFSGTNKILVLEQMNKSIEDAYHFLKKTEHIVITLGTSFVYKHIARNIYVGNNHKIPAASFTKEILTTQDNEHCLNQLIEAVKSINPTAQFIFTVSPVRHVRDGLVENNLSKASLINAVHKFSNKGYYFPAYELVIDVLRDYRFYTEDLVHPNKQAIDFVWRIFEQKCLSEKDNNLRIELAAFHKKLHHRPLHAESEAYQKFQTGLVSQMKVLQEKYSYVDFTSSLESLF